MTSDGHETTAKEQRERRPAHVESSEEVRSAGAWRDLLIATQPPQVGRNVTPGTIFRLQRTIGNHAVAAMVSRGAGDGLGIQRMTPSPGIFAGPAGGLPPPLIRPPYVVPEIPPGAVPLSEAIKIAEAEEAFETVAVITQVSEVAAFWGMVSTGLLVLTGVLVIVAVAAGTIYLLTTDFPVAKETFLPGGVAGPTEESPARELPPGQATHPMSEPGTPDPIVVPGADGGTPISEPTPQTSPITLPGAGTDAGKPTPLVTAGTAAMSAAKISDIDTQVRELRSKYAVDPQAVERLRTLYGSLTDEVLAKYLRRGTKFEKAIAKSIYEQRIPANEQLPKLQESDRHPPGHNASAVYRNSKGQIEWTNYNLTSGNLSDAEKAKPFPQAMNESHTEQRALKLAPLGKGGTLRITGQYDPCDSCQRAMIEASKATGATIHYWWPGGEFVAKAGVGQFL